MIRFKVVARHATEKVSWVEVKAMDGCILRESSTAAPMNALTLWGLPPAQFALLPIGQVLELRPVDAQ